MADDKDVQKVKLVGLLWTTKLVLSILRDILLIVFLIVAVVGIVFAVTSLSSALSGAGGIEGLVGSIANGGHGSSEQSGGQEGPEQIVKELQQDVNNNDWESASAKVDQLQFIVQQRGNPAEEVYALQQLKQGIAEKDKAKVYKVLQQVQNVGATN